MKSFQNLTQFSLLTILSIAFSSCCTKKLCEGFDHINEIQMLNFTAEEVDSISLEIFQSGSNFTERIDSNFTAAHVRSTNYPDLYLTLNENISNDHVYKITLLSIGTGQVYVVNNFTKKKEECNRCFPDSPSSNYYDVLESFEVNGEKINNYDLSITK